MIFSFPMQSQSLTIKQVQQDYYPEDKLLQGRGKKGKKHTKFLLKHYCLEITFNAF